MGQIEDYRLFALVVENQSISKAAEKLNIAKSAVSRRLNLLEERFGTRLIDREPGIWKVTATGAELYQRAINVVNDVDEIESDFIDSSHELAGPLTVSVPRDFGMAFLQPALLGFKAKYPKIQLTVDFDDRAVDLNRENYDFTIRIAPMIEDGLSAEKIGTSLHHLCASPEYLKTHGQPKTLSELKSHKLLHFGAAKRVKWTFLNQTGKSETIEFQPELNSNNGSFLIRAAEKGLGIVLAPDFISAPQQSAKTLVPILTSYKMNDWGIYLIHAQSRRLNRRMRLFTEEIKAACLEICN